MLYLLNSYKFESFYCFKDFWAHNVTGTLNEGFESLATAFDFRAETDTAFHPVLPTNSSSIVR